jgi:virginiamycin B lyase
MRSIRSIVPRFVVASTTAAVLAFTPSPGDFGLVTAGQSAAQTFTLANTGGSAVPELNVMLSGPAAFTVTTDTCTGTDLGPGKSCTVTVQFSPPGTGVVTATLTAVSKKAAVTATDPLTGTGAPGAHLYWTDFGAFPNTGTIGEANLDGTGATTIVTGQNGALGVAVGASNIYWADRNSGTIMQANLDGTGVTTLVSGQSFPDAVTVSASHIYWTTLGTGSGNDSIMQANLDGTGVTPLVTGQNGTGGIAVDASHIYWTDPVDGSIMRANLDGTGLTTLVAGQNAPQWVAVDASHIYWTDASTTGGTIMESNLDGTGVTTLITGQDAPEGVAVDSSHVYWVDTNIFAANLDGSNPHSVVSGLGFGFNDVAVGPQ